MSIKSVSLNIYTILAYNEIRDQLQQKRNIKHTKFADEEERGKKMKKDDEVKQQMVWHGNVNKCFSKLLPIKVATKI